MLDSIDIAHKTGAKNVDVDLRNIYFIRSKVRF